MAAQRWVELYRSKRTGEWRWRVRARNLKVLADSGEGYKARGEARRMAQSLFPALDIREEDPPSGARQPRRPAPKDGAGPAARTAKAVR